jgi:hypothetical protein
MKVLFDFSRQEITSYKKALDEIRQSILINGHTLTKDLIKETEELGNELPKDFFGKLTKSISEADCVIIEGTTISISLGYILTRSIYLGKPVLFISDCAAGSHKSRFLRSIQTKLLHIQVYNSVKDIRLIISKFLEECPDIKTRFNLVLSNKLNSYITEQSNKLKISKTEFIINLIEKDIKTGSSH